MSEPVACNAAEGGLAPAHSDAGRGPRRHAARALCAELGIDWSTFAARNLPFYAEARQLAFAGLGSDGRDKFLVPGAARAWRALHAAARDEAGLDLLLISAFRSLAYQAALIRNKLGRGLTLDAILAVNAPPGGSEHHTGRAVDVGVAGCAALDEAFELTPAFAWLVANASRFGFAMSYPRGNPQGYVYEPWHWCWQGVDKVTPVPALDAASAADSGGIPT